MPINVYMHQTQYETIIIVFLLMLLFVFKYSAKSNIILLEAFDNEQYIVNDLPDSQIAANTLAQIMTTLNKLVTNIINDYNNLPTSKHTDDDKQYIDYIKTIQQKLKHVQISETPLFSSFTSYSIKKGQKLVFCLRSKKTNKIHDINELLYVAIHEIAHIGCPEYGHTDLFKKINQYMLTKAIKYKLYKYVDYYNEPREYCGINLTSTIATKSNSKV